MCNCKSPAQQCKCLYFSVTNSINCQQRKLLLNMKRNKYLKIAQKNNYSHNQLYITQILVIHKST